MFGAVAGAPAAAVPGFAPTAAMPAAPFTGAPAGLPPFMMGQQ
jgi:hypothetical protein